MHILLRAAAALLALQAAGTAQSATVPGASNAGPANNDSRIGGSGGGHGLYLNGVGSSRFVFVEAGRFEQDRASGTARLTGLVVDRQNSGRGFDVDIQFTGLTFTPPAGSPKLELDSGSYATGGGAIDSADWYYFEVTDGTITGTGDYAGAVAHVTRLGEAFQVGFGASGKNALYGASGWLDVCFTHQPNNGHHLPGQVHGDLNFDLSPDCLCVTSAAGENHFWPNHRDDAFETGNLGCPSDRWDFATVAVLERDTDNGTVRVTGELVNRGDPACRLCVDLVFGDRVAPLSANYPPNGSPVVSFDQSFLDSNGGPIDPDSWTYYTTVTGTLSGKDGLEGAVIDVSRRGSAAQFGQGASRDTGLGASGWLDLVVVSQPNNGPHLQSADGDFDFSFEVCDRPAFAQPSGSTPSLPTITQDCFRLRGPGLDTVTEIDFAGQTISSNDPCDFGRGWFEVSGDCELCFYPPFCLPAGTYDFVARNGAGEASNTVSLEIVEPTDPTLVCPPEWEIGKPFSIWLDAGDTPNAALFTIYTPIGDPFIIPGIIELDIAGPSGIYVCGPPLMGDCVEDFFGSIPATVAGLRIYFQGIVIDTSNIRFPLGTTNVCYTDFGAAPSTNLVDGGSFEGNPAVASGGLVTYTDGEVIYGDWTVRSGDVEVHHNASNGGQGAGADGDQHLDLNGNERGSIRQTVGGLAPGASYTLRFRHARHDGASSQNTARVRIGDLDQTWSNSVSGRTRWETAEFTFTANSASHSLRFDSQDDGWAGMLIDAVEIVRN